MNSFSYPPSVGSFILVRMVVWIKRVTYFSSSTRSRDTRAIQRQASLSCGKLSVVFTFPLPWTATTSAASDQIATYRELLSNGVDFLTMFSAKQKHQMTFKAWTLRWTGGGRSRWRLVKLKVQSTIMLVKRLRDFHSWLQTTTPTWQHYLFLKASRTLFGKMLFARRFVCSTFTFSFCMF